MKALPKRKGNSVSPSACRTPQNVASMKALPKRKGNLDSVLAKPEKLVASMKVPTKK